MNPSQQTEMEKLLTAATLGTAMMFLSLFLSGWTLAFSDDNTKGAVYPACSPFHVLAVALVGSDPSGVILCRVELVQVGKAHSGKDPFLD